MGGELMQLTAVRMEGIKILPDAPDISVGTVELDTEKMTAAFGAIKAAGDELSWIWERTIKTVQNIADAILREYELRWAIRLATAHNPRLVRFYRHTKKGRIRKKYAKRILAWYREEVLAYDKF